MSSINPDIPISHHHDGHGLNESIVIQHDKADKSGAGHLYEFSIETKDGFPVIGRIQFQKGPRNVEGSTPGATEAAILAMLIDRVEGFQSGPYACAENEEFLGHIRAALAATKARADERAARGVLGKNQA